MEKSKEGSFYTKWLSLLKLETTTTHGRINLSGLIVITAFCLLYSTDDAIRHLISSVEGTIKTIALNKDIHYEYEGVSFYKAVLPIIIVFVLCILFLAWQESRKKK